MRHRNKDIIIIIIIIIRKYPHLSPQKVFSFSLYPHPTPPEIPVKLHTFLLEPHDDD